jgi:hypothetical protein
MIIAAIISTIIKKQHRPIMLETSSMPYKKTDEFLNPFWEIRRW